MTVKGPQLSTSCAKSSKSPRILGSQRAKRASRSKRPQECHWFAVVNVSPHSGHCHSSLLLFKTGPGNLTSNHVILRHRSGTPTSSTPPPHLSRLRYTRKLGKHGSGPPFPIAFPNAPPRIATRCFASPPPRAVRDGTVTREPKGALSRSQGSDRTAIRLSRFASPTPSSTSAPASLLLKTSSGLLAVTPPG